MRLQAKRGLALVRQHVNPLALQHQILHDPFPSWGSSLVNPNLNLHVDIGSNRGQLQRRLVEIEPSFNFLGVEVHPQYLARAQKTTAHERIAYAKGNANLHLSQILTGYPGSVPIFTSLFPDPWSIKTRHYKRRVLTSSFFDLCASICRADSSHKEPAIFIVKTDVDAVHRYSVEAAALSDGWERAEIADVQGLSASKIANFIWDSAASEREESVTARQLDVKKAIFILDN